MHACMQTGARNVVQSPLKVAAGMLHLWGLIWCVPGAA